MQDVVCGYTGGASIRSISFRAPAENGSTWEDKDYEAAKSPYKRLSTFTYSTSVFPQDRFLAVSDYRNLVENVESYAQRLSRRNYSRDGIEMYLALDDLRSGASDADAVVPGGPALADAAEAVAQRILSTRQGDPVRALRLATEVLAAYDLRSGDLSAMSGRKRSEPDPAATGAGRPPLRLSGGAQAGAAGLVTALRRGQFLRAINFHNTTRSDAKVLQRQLRALAERYQSVTEPDLIGLAAGEPWRGQRPPLLLTFYEGLRNGVEVAAPLLEEAGLRGFFCLIPGFLDAPVGEQQAFAEARRIGLIRGEYEDGRYALSWDEVRDLLRRGHDVACHTMTHNEPSEDLGDADLRMESVGAVSRMEAELGRKVATFVWRRGLAWGEDGRGDAFLQEAGVSLLLSNFKLQHLPAQA